VRSQQIAQLIFPRLVTLDEQDKPTDWAAERHEVSADGLTYTFHLRKGMTWSDGTSIDTQTFAYSINRALDPCTDMWNPIYLYPIQSAQAFNTGACPVGATKSSATLLGSSLLAPDPLTLEIVLQQPTGYFLSAPTNSISWEFHRRWSNATQGYPRIQMITRRQRPHGRVISPTMAAWAASCINWRAGRML
jgi:ABC-type transport system substrate-binding protein